MRALITGIGGFVGRHLLRHLRDKGDEVWGIARTADAVDLPTDVTLRCLDLLDRDALFAAVRQTQPDAVYHLAAVSSTRDSLQDPWGTIANNLRAQMHLLDALVACGSQARVVVVLSSDEYGRPSPEHVPTSEQAPLQPTSPYGVSKVAQDALAYQYFAQFGLAVVRVRPFAHTGPGHDARFALPSFAKQVAEIESGLRETVLRVGNLDVWRDYTDVRDVARAYRLAALAGVPGDVYNLGRGTAFHLRAVVDDLVALSRVPIQVAVDPDLLRPTDVPRQEADTRKFRDLTGWQPEIPWPTTLSEMLDSWRARVAVAPSVH